VTYSTCHTLPYPVHVGSALLPQLRALVPVLDRAHRIAVITDHTVKRLYADAVVASVGDTRTHLISISAGEISKTRETWSHITDELLGAQFGRDSAVIALGGGVIGDIAGFVAATYLRGIPVVQVPTTLLAMVDASIGGKTGVDTAHGKNLVGAFHPPQAVVADVDTLATLPARERQSGVAEMVKHGFIADATYVERLTHTDFDAPLSANAWTSLVLRSVEIKGAAVAADERESGIRKTLNFGHTIGHAIEHLLAYTLPHGHCVAIGMVVEARLAAALALCDSALPTQIARVLERVGLPTTIPHALTPEAILSGARHDKKVRRGHVEYALPIRAGAMAVGSGTFGIAVPDAVVLAVLTHR
jgi:3-dehydroquinate synthase